MGMRLSKAYRNDKVRKDRLKAAKKKYGGRTVFEHTVVITVVTIVCCAVDFYTVKGQWTMLRADDVFFIYGKSLVHACALDVSLSILAIAQRRKECDMLGKREFKLIAALSLGVFITALIFEVYLAVLTGKYSFALSEGSSTIMFEGQTINSGSDVALSVGEITTVSLINGLTPALTSAVVYLTTYFAYDPVRDELRIYHMDMINTEHAKLNLIMAIKEMGDQVKHIEVLSSLEDSKYKAHLDKLRSLKVLRKQISYLAAMKVLDKDGVSHIKSSADTLNSEAKSPSEELTTAMETLKTSIKPIVGGENSSRKAPDEEGGKAAEKAKPALKTAA